MIGWDGLTDQTSSVSRGVAPGQGAGGAHQSTEDLREVGGVQHQQTHAAENALMYSVDDGLVDCGMGCMSPPGQDVGTGQDLLGQTMLWLILGSRADGNGVTQQLDRFRRRWRRACRLGSARPCPRDLVRIVRESSRPIQ